jgi:hypothetical protein
VVAAGLIGFAGNELVAVYRAEAAVLVDPALTVIDGHEIAVTAHQLLHDVPGLT